MLAAEIEPNDTFPTATPLPVGDVLQGELTNSADVDYFVVDLTRGDEFSINTFNTASALFSPTLPPGLEVLDSSGRTLARSNDGDTIGLVAPSTGQYFVEISATNDFGIFIGEYSMQSSHRAAQGSLGGLQFDHRNDPNAFVDISASGTALNLVDDQVVNVTTTVGNQIFPAGPTAISNNGLIFSGLSTSAFVNTQIPSAQFDTALLPFWDDIHGTRGNTYWQETQVNGINALIVQWHMRPHFLLDNGTDAVTFQLQLFESGPVLARYAYQDVVFGNATYDNGASATIGYQQDNANALQFSFNQDVLADGDVLDLIGSGGESEPNDLDRPGRRRDRCDRRGGRGTDCQHK